jgi:hypothetical protein
MIYEGRVKPFLNKNNALAEKPLSSKQGVGGSSPSGIAKTQADSMGYI